MLKRMRHEGLDRAWVPFAKRHFLAWRGRPEPNLDFANLIQVVKVCCSIFITPRCWPASGAPASRENMLLAERVGTLQGGVIMGLQLWYSCYASVCGAAG